MSPKKDPEASGPRRAEGYERLPDDGQLLRPDFAPGPQPQKVDAARKAAHVELPLLYRKCSGAERRRQRADEVDEDDGGDD